MNILQLKQYRIEKPFQLLFHVISWTFIFCIPVVNSSFSNQSFTGPHLEFAVIALFIFYSNYLFFIPRFFITKRYLFYGLINLVLFVILVEILSRILPNGQVGPFENLPSEVIKEINENTFIKYFPPAILFVSLLSISILLRIFEVYNTNLKRQKEIEADRKNAQLQLLKSQLNPHFFFSALNTIYALSISKSDSTSSAILNLSEIMRYVLKENTDNESDGKVNLQEDLNHIRNFISLTEWRLTSNNKILFDVSGDVGNHRVHPLLFISFVENALKYGISLNDPAEIKINFTVTSTQIYFYCANKIIQTKKQVSSFESGIENAKKRLSLLYPDYKLKIEQDNEMFQVFLNFEL
ncbi:histidine kinase [Flavobacterium sp.]|uniref:sensor histidine kinase n=1 Tax=Flavobacterium sp. TaxID=239 RepID=UPI002630BE39|nr:histidine kinase [Flavobacterium sp.]